MLEDLSPTRLRKMEAKLERGIADGLAWLAHHWSVEENPGRKYYHLMYLYGLERVGDLLNRHLIGKHDWYWEGAAWLVEQQRSNGRWERDDTHGPRDVLNTCFALLFLDRATRSVPVTAKED
jgi:hypothetical protein